MNAFTDWFGEKSMYTLYQLVHPDDRDEFELYLAAAESDKVIFIRIQLKVDKYHWFILRKVDEHNETDGRHLIELRLSDVIAQNSKFDMYTINVSKYRAMLTMFNRKYLSMIWKQELLQYTFTVTVRQRFLNGMI